MLKLKVGAIFAEDKQKTESSKNTGAICFKLFFGQWDKSDSWFGPQKRVKLTGSKGCNSHQPLGVS